MRVFFDVDDTLNNFSLDYARSFGFPADWGWYDPSAGYNLMHAMRTARPKIRRGWRGGRIIPEGDLPAIKKNFWAKLKPCNLSLLDSAAQLFGKENVFIATKPQMTPCCLTGKLQWIQEHLPDWIQHQIFIATHKQLLGKPGYILVDDRESTLLEFAALGGTAIGIPRPWNGYREEPLKMLLKAYADNLTT